MDPGQRGDFQVYLTYWWLTLYSQDWKPGATPAPTAPAPAPSGDAADLDQQVTKQGDLVRSLKAAKAEKAKIDEAVKTLLELKAKYKAATGQVSKYPF